MSSLLLEEEEEGGGEEITASESRNPKRSDSIEAEELKEGAERKEKVPGEQANEEEKEEVEEETGITMQVEGGKQVMRDKGDTKNENENQRNEKEAEDDERLLELAAVGASLIRHRVRIYSRSRDNNPPSLLSSLLFFPSSLFLPAAHFENDVLLRVRDAFVHGNPVYHGMNGLGNIVTCLLSHEDVLCPGFRSLQRKFTLRHLRASRKMNTKSKRRMEKEITKRLW